MLVSALPALDFVFNNFSGVRANFCIAAHAYPHALVNPVHRRWNFYFWHLHQLKIFIEILRARDLNAFKRDARRPNLLRIPA